MRNKVNKEVESAVVPEGSKLIKAANLLLLML